MATEHMVDIAAAGDRRPPTAHEELRGQHLLAGASDRDGDDILALARVATARAHNRHGCRPGCRHPRHARDVQECLWALRMLGLTKDADT